MAAARARLLQARRLLLSARPAPQPMDAPPRPALPPPAPSLPPPGPPPGRDTGDVLQQIMAITDQSLEEAQARCCSGAGPPKVEAVKGAGRGARARAARGVKLRRGLGEIVGCVSEPGWQVWGP